MQEQTDGHYRDEEGDDDGHDGDFGEESFVRRRTLRLIAKHIPRDDLDMATSAEHDNSDQMAVIMYDFLRVL
jgi:hypothetical protein